VDLSTHPEDEALLWQRMRSSGDTHARERLLGLHMPYAKIVAASYYSKRFHDEIEFGDYQQLACVGLLEAMERYDPARGVQFRTFAARRMHGAILNGLEKLTEKQQQIAVRQRLRLQRLQDVRDNAIAQAGGALGGAQTPEQLMRFIAEVGVGLAVCWMLEDTAMVEIPGATGTAHFYQGVQLKQMRDKLLHGIERLPTQERTVLKSHYLQDVPFERIAAELELTKGRISQIHRQALLHLRKMLGPAADWDLSC
jgi:RNA polymerase sigma factor for flagellar operon FliA